MMQPGEYTLSFRVNGAMLDSTLTVPVSAADLSISSSYLEQVGVSTIIAGQVEDLVIKAFDQYMNRARVDSSVRVLAKESGAALPIIYNLTTGFSQCTILSTRSGVFNVAAFFGGVQFGSTLALTVVPATLVPSSLRLKLQPPPGLVRDVAGQKSTLVVYGFDAYGNAYALSPENRVGLDAFLVPSSEPTSPTSVRPLNLTLSSDVTSMAFAYAATASGPYVISITYGGSIGKNLTTFIFPAATSAQDSTLSLSPVQPASGSPALVSIIARDRFGNRKTDGGDPFALQLTSQDRV